MQTVRWEDNQVVMIDQTALPGRLEWLRFSCHQDVARAIIDMKVRGAPAIGVTAALGIALGALSLPDDPPTFDKGFAEVCRLFSETRPTAVNLFWAINRLQALRQEMAEASIPGVKAAIRDEAIRMVDEDIETNRALGQHGAELLQDGWNVLTHCNAGALACAGYGTALGVIRGAVEIGKRIRVFADETRPRLQGARLTAWELHQDDIPVTVICDNMAASLMRAGQIQAVVVGADRIARNGDVANKIGTYSAALAARYHDLPFYVAAPLSTVDFSLASGAEIPIERRGDSEVTRVGGEMLTPEGVPVLNPAFDVTPADLVTAIVTERGVARPPFERSLRAMMDRLPVRGEVAC